MDKTPEHVAPRVENAQKEASENVLKRHISISSSEEHNARRKRPGNRTIPSAPPIPNTDTMSKFQKLKRSLDDLKLAVGSELLDRLPVDKLVVEHQSDRASAVSIRILYGRKRNKKNEKQDAWFYLRCNNAGKTGKLYVYEFTNNSEPAPFSLHMVATDAKEVPFAALKTVRRVTTVAKYYFLHCLVAKYLANTNPEFPILVHDQAFLEDLKAACYDFQKPIENSRTSFVQANNQSKPQPQALPPLSIPPRLLVRPRDSPAIRFQNSQAPIRPFSRSAIRSFGSDEMAENGMDSIAGSVQEIQTPARATGPGPATKKHARNVRAARENNPSASTRTGFPVASWDELPREELRRTPRLDFPEALRSDQTQAQHQPQCQAQRDAPYQVTVVTVTRSTNSEDCAAIQNSLLGTPRGQNFRQAPSQDAPLAQVQVQPQPAEASQVASTEVSVETASPQTSLAGAAPQAPLGAATPQITIKAESPQELQAELPQVLEAEARRNLAARISNIDMAINNLVAAQATMADERRRLQEELDRV